MNKTAKLGNMELFQVVKVSKLTFIERVPGGWVRDLVSEGGGSSVFIPLSKETGNEEYELIETI